MITRFSVSLVFTILLLAMIHLGIIRWGKIDGVKEHSNYFSSLSRIETAMNVVTADIAICGSSLSGRLPASENIINLGVDGGSAGQSLNILKNGKFSKPNIICIEANSLYSDTLEQEDKIVDVVNSITFNWRRGVTLFQSHNRPTGLFYKVIRSKFMPNNQRPSGNNEVKNIEIGIPSEGFSVVENVDWVKKSSFNKCVQQLRHIKNNGVETLVIVWIPNGVGSGDRKESLKNYAKAVAGETRAYFIDLEGLETNGSIQYSDGVHLSPSSAEYTQECLLNSIKAITLK